jgi:hypothetical protein
MCRDERLIGRLVLLAVASAASASGAPPAEAPESEVVVQGMRPRQDAWNTRFNRGEAASAAGTEGDPAKVVEDLPGVAHASLGADPLVLWGSSAKDTRVVVDGVEIPSLFHGGALRSTVDGDLIGAIALTPGAYGADFGRALGGLVRIDTRELPQSGWHGAIDVNVLDASTFGSAVIDGRVRVAIGGRYGYLDRTIRAAGIDYANDVFPIPRYGDYFAKVQLDLRDRESLDVLLLGSRDSLTRTANAGDPAHVLQSTTGNAFERVALRYRRTLNDGARIDVTPWIGRDVSTFSAHFGENPEGLDEHDLRWGLRAEERSLLGSDAVLSLGMDTTGTHASVARRGSLTLPAREGDVSVFGEAPGNDSDSDRWNAAVVDVAPYASVDWKIGPVSVEPALRADGYLIEASRKTPRVGQTPSIGASDFRVKAAPRLSIRARLSTRVTAFGAIGLYSEPPAPSDLSAVFGTPTLGPSSAEHATLGEAVALSRTLSATITGFFKWMDHLAVRDQSTAQPVAQALTAKGVGVSYGVQFLLLQRPWHGLSGWLSYTISRSERRDVDGAPLRLFDQDEPNVFVLAANQVLGPYRLGLRLRAASGQPRTPVEGALYDEKDDVMQPVFGAQNSIRLPAFWQIDVRADRSFTLGDGAAFSIYVEALNVTDHANTDDYVYDTRYNGRGAIAGIPVLGVVGMRLER